MQDSMRSFHSKKQYGYVNVSVNLAVSEEIRTKNTRKQVENGVCSDEY